MAETKIRKLPPEVIGHIAAGEVVERPAAAIKELVENSMDAGASSVVVEIRAGGLDLLRVTDNGVGIAEEDLRMAFERHATSKLRTSEDLSHVGTLGFRGEALASIAAVSRVTLLSRRRGSASGMKVVNEGGRILDIAEAACAEGTSVTVRDLFFNVPVRRGFQKRPQTEAAQVSDLMTRLILSQPETSFRLTSEGKNLLFSPGEGRLESAVMSVYGTSSLKAFIPIEGNQAGVLLSGYVGVGDEARGNRSHQSFFLNGRAIRSELLSRALEEALRQRVPTGRFPLSVLHLTLPFDAVDVNVHPNKWEVRFRDEHSVYDAVKNVLSEFVFGGAAQALPPPLLPREPVARQEASILRSEVEPGLRPQEPHSLKTASPLPGRDVADAMRLRDPAREEPEKAPRFLTEVAEVPAEDHPRKLEAEPVPTLTPALEATQVRLIGTAFDTYILFEGGGALILCDQHALHERLLYDRMVAALEEGTVSQMLLLPRVLQLTWREHAVLSEHRSVLARVGFDLEDFGDRSVRMKAIPMELGEPVAEGCLREALDELESTGSLSGQKKLERILQTACKHAVKGGERLPEQALISLVRDMLDGNITPTCPHGRPLMLSFTRQELDRRFGRIQG